MRKLVTLFFCVAGIIGIILFISSCDSDPVEPVYNGKKLSEWLQITDPNKRDYHLSQASSEAVQNMGTNALPHLLRMLVAKDSDAKAWFGDLLNKQSLIDVSITRDHNFHTRSVAGFEALGAKAASVVPALIQMLEDTNSPNSFYASFALGAIGPTAIPALIQALTNKNASVRRDAAQSLRYMHCAEDAIPALLQCLGDKNSSVQGAAAMALGDLKKQPQLVVPVLVQHLNDNDAYTRGQIVEALGEYGKQAEEAAAKLKELQNDPDPTVRWKASNAFEKIKGHPAKP